MEAVERSLPRRFRRTKRGALRWPALVALTLVDGLLMHRLPPARFAIELGPALLVASFANLLLACALAPWLARRVPASAPGSFTASGATLDRMAVALLVAGAAGLLAAGLAARPLVVSETEQTERNGAAVRAYVDASGDAELRRNVDFANQVRLEDGRFRTCVPRDDRLRAICFLVDTKPEPPAVRRDPSGVPNGKLFGE